MKNVERKNKTIKYLIKNKIFVAEDDSRIKNKIYFVTTKQITENSIKHVIGFTITKY